MTENNKPRLRKTLRLLALDARTTPKRVRKSLKRQGLLNAVKEMLND